MAEIRQITQAKPGRLIKGIQGIPSRVEFNSNSPIGMFDSGVGGLTVLSRFQAQMPNESIIYLADTARVPYGGRSSAEIININKEIIEYFISLGVKMIVMACGTSSAIAYPVLKDKYKVPLLSIIEGGARLAKAATRNKKIGVIATAGTIGSNAYQKTLKELDSAIEVYGTACPLLVPLIEGGFAGSEETKRVIKEYLKPLMNSKIDTLILGCTHYPHVSGFIKEIVGSNIRLIDPADDTVFTAREILTKDKTINNKKEPATYTFHVTGSLNHFKELGSRLFGKPITNAEEVTLVKATSKR